MAGTLYRFDGPLDNSGATTQLVLETDEGGAPTRALGVGQVGELTDDEFDFWSQRLKLEKVNKTDKDNVYGLGFEHLAPKTKDGDDTKGPDGKPVDEPGVTQAAPRPGFDAGN